MGLRMKKFDILSVYLKIRLLGGEGGEGGGGGELPKKGVLDTLQI